MSATINTHPFMIPPYPHAILCNGATRHWFDGDGFVMMCGIEDYAFDTNPLEYVHHDYMALLEQALQQHCRTRGMWELTLFIEDVTWNRLSIEDQDNILYLQCPCCKRTVRNVYTSCWWPMDS